MQFTIAAAALFGTVALAAPAPQGADVRETLSLQDFSAHKKIVAGTTAAKVDSVSFQLVGSREEATFGVVCKGAAAAGADEIVYNTTTAYDCNGDKEHNYYFHVVRVDDKDVFTLRVNREVTSGWGYQSLVEVPTYCHAGGANSMACAQIGGEVDIEMRI
ncbi:hypothetical protein PG999_000249 [Apiospora kogelbergensis]|uniref:AA1-like domain-containing protein n=1 Tax=Apiospora kogelbergensis TaxID=1337665 RepID=A0AAW0RBC2_9PEZI